MDLPQFTGRRFIGHGSRWSTADGEHCYIVAYGPPFAAAWVGTHHEHLAGDEGRRMHNGGTVTPTEYWHADSCAELLAFVDWPAPVARIFATAVNVANADAN